MAWLWVPQPDVTGPKKPCPPNPGATRGLALWDRMLIRAPGPSDLTAGISGHPPAPPTCSSITFWGQPCVLTPLMAEVWPRVWTGPCTSLKALKSPAGSSGIQETTEPSLPYSPGPCPQQGPLKGGG